MDQLRAGAAGSVTTDPPPPPHPQVAALMADYPRVFEEAIGVEVNPPVKHEI